MHNFIQISPYQAIDLDSVVSVTFDPGFRQLEIILNGCKEPVYVQRADSIREIVGRFRLHEMHSLLSSQLESS